MKPKIEKFKLKNGIEVIHFPLSETKVVTTLCLFGVGSRFENKIQNGLSHYLEHLFFKGTKNRPSTLKIAEELDALGAQYNAFTSEESTGYFVEVENRNFPKALEILSDLLKNPLFDKTELEREKTVIIEEINMYKDMPQRYIQDLAKQNFFGNTPLGRDIAGTKENIINFTRQSLLSYKENFYHTDNMHIVVAGNTHGLNLKKNLESHFSTLSKKEKPDYEKIKPILDGPKAKLLFKKTDQAHLVLGFLGIPYNHNLRVPAALLAIILGGGMSSRLFIKIRERRGLAYYVNSSSDNFHDTGIFATQTGVIIKKIDEAIKIILDEYKDIIKTKVSKTELEKAKNILRGEIVIDAERSEELAMFLGGQAIYGKEIQTPEELLAAIEKVAPEELHKFAKGYFLPESLKLTIIGPYKKEEEFKKLIKNF